jgi:hypothetical protein
VKNCKPYGAKGKQGLYTCELSPGVAPRKSKKGDMSGSEMQRHLSGKRSKSKQQISEKDLDDPMNIKIVNEKFVDLCGENSQKNGYLSANLSVLSSNFFNHSENNNLELKSKKVNVRNVVSEHFLNSLVSRNNTSVDQALAGGNCKPADKNTANLTSVKDSSSEIQ